MCLLPKEIIIHAYNVIAVYSPEQIPLLRDQCRKNQLFISLKSSYLFEY